MHVDEAWVNLLEQCLSKTHKYAAKQGELREVIGAHVILDGSAEQFLMNPRRKLSPIYASAELLWYLSRTKDASMICAYAPSYKEFCDEDGTAYGAYGHRIADNIYWTTDGAFELDQLEVAVTLLKKRSTTKKCIVSMWRPCDLVHAHDGTHPDVPCTLTWQFIARGERLHMICSMRSNDLWKGFLYDCYVNTVIQRYIAASLGLTAGEYHHISGSMHLYEKDLKKAEEALREHYVSGPWEFEMVYPSNSYWTDKELQSALAHEEAMRCKKLGSFNCEMHPQPLRDALLCCLAKHTTINDTVAQLVRVPGLRKALERWCATK